MRTERAGSPSPVRGVGDTVLAAAGGNDLDQILELEESAFAPAQRWDSRSWASELAGDAMHTIVARADRHNAATTGALGVIAVRLLGDQADLDRLIVHPGVRLRGIAQSLLNAGLDTVIRSGVTEMMLEVRRDNRPAIALYEAADFDALMTRADYYGPQVDAVIMKRVLS